MPKDKINFELNGKNVSAFADETIWEVSERLGENNHLYVANYHRMAGLCLLNNNRDIIF